MQQCDKLEVVLTSMYMSLFSQSRFCSDDLHKKKIKILELTYRTEPIVPK